MTIVVPGVMDIDRFRVGSIVISDADGSYPSDQIPGHHIVYSAMPDQLAVFTRLEGAMVPQIYPAEPLREWLNRRAGTAGP